MAVEHGPGLEAYLGLDAQGVAGTAHGIADGSEVALGRLQQVIYDAALDPALWRDVLEKIAGFVGGQSAGLVLMDSASKAVNAHWAFGRDPHYLQLHIDQYVKFDPSMAMVFRRPSPWCSPLLSPARS